MKFDTQHNVSVVMLSAANKPLVQVVMLNVVIPSVIVLSVFPFVCVCSNVRRGILFFRVTNALAYYGKVYKIATKIVLFYVVNIL